MDEHNRVIYLLRKFIANTCTPEEFRETEQLISEGIDDAIWMEVLTEHEKNFLTQPERTSSPQARQRLERIRASITAADRTKQNKRIFFPTQIRWVAAAASILIAVLLFPQLKSYINSYDQASYIQLTTVEKQRKKINTADGSEIWINNNSSLRYPEQFEDKKREVFLEGEGFFEVTKNPDKPFIVRAGDLSVNVLGTSFDVQSYPEDDEIIITLESGKVEAEWSGSKGNAPRTVTLSPGEQLIYSKTSHQYVIRDVDPYASYAWKDNVLMFDQEPLYRIVKVLERNYGVDIKINDEQLKEKKITFRQNDENMADIMEVLSFSAGFSYSIEEKKIIITKQ